MVAEPITEMIPIYRDRHGRYRIGNTNILLDLVVGAYHRGETPESIVDMYPTLALDDVYLVIAYYLRHRIKLDTYLQNELADAEKFRQTYQADNPSILTREILMVRLAKKQQADSE
ncbi:MAG: DUF433 domain-containing protein [Aggregatilineales bacterium]